MKNAAPASNPDGVNSVRRIPEPVPAPGAPATALPCYDTLRDFFLLHPLPEEVTRLPHREQMIEVGRLVRDHYRNLRRCYLAEYEYRCSADAVFRFSVDGEYLGRVDGIPQESRTFVRIAGRKVATPMKFLTDFSGD